jgi:preprotein translocase subunit SecG
VGLGTCKSEGTKSITSSTTVSNDNKTSSILSKSTNNLSFFFLLFVLASNLNAIDHELKIKVQELRIYETVLTQRIHAIKSIANDTPIPDIKVEIFLVLFV